jgi:hypothetical protein
MINGSSRRCACVLPVVTEKFPLVAARRCLLALGRSQYVVFLLSWTKPGRSVHFVLTSFGILMASGSGTMNHNMLSLAPTLCE